MDLKPASAPLLIALTGCPGDAAETNGEETGNASTGEPACSAPAEWAAPNWTANVAGEMALSDALAFFTGDDFMRGAETGAVDIADLAALSDAYAQGEPSLASITHAGFRARIDDAFTDFIDVVAAGNISLLDAGAWTPGDSGGIWGDDNRGLNAGGIEVRQIVDKGMFSAGGLYFHATTLTAGDIDEATVDRIAYAWGANEALDPDGELDDGANYSQQQGFHAEMVEQLIAMKAHAADPGCTAERDAATVEFFRLWELSMASRYAFYMSETALGLAAAVSDTEFAAALHELNEGIGLMSGFHGMPDPASGPLSGGARVATDAQIEMLLGAIGVDLGDLGSSTVGPFVESLPAFEAAQGEAEALLIAVYGVDEATLASWRTPTPG